MSFATRLWTRLRRFAGVAIVLLAAAPSASALIYRFENTTSGTISFAATPCTSPLIRTINVPNAITISSVSLGTTLSHSYRGDVSVILTSPAGTTVQLRDADPFINDPDDNYDLLFSDASPNPVDNGASDPVTTPYFERHVAPDNSMTAFSGENAQGNWTVRICDSFSADNGTFARARLIIEDAIVPAANCTTSATYDWASNGDNNAFTSASVGDITFSQTATTDPDGIGSAPNNVTLTGVLGNHAGYYQTAMDAANDFQRGLTVRYSFDPPAHDLAFSLLDIDEATWDDLLRIDAFDSSGTLLPYRAVTANPLAVGDVYDGNVPNEADTSPAGNVDFRFTGGVATLDYVYMVGDDSAANNFQRTGISDFSFCGYDFGDAPSSYTTSLGGGARHDLRNRQLYLGTRAPDGESDGQPGAAANDDGIEEDGVASFPAQALSPGDTYSVNVTVTNNTGSPATVCGWVDFDLDGGAGDGTFEADEGVCVSTSSCSGSAPQTCTLDFTVPADFVFVENEPTYARFRTASSGLTVGTPGGRVVSGEVEDYQIPPNTLPITLGWLLAQDRAGQLNVEWQTLSEVQHIGFHLWGWVNSEQVRLNHTLIPAPDTNIDAADYSWSGEVPEGLTAVSLVTVSTQGHEQWFGPFSRGQAFGQRMRTEAAVSTPRIPATRSSVTNGVFLRTAQPGIYRAEHDDLLAVGLNLSGVAVDSIRLTYRGQSYARRILGADSGRWSNDSAVEFYASELAPEASLHTSTDAYRLGVGTGAIAARTIPYTFSAIPPQRSYRTLQWFGSQNLYTFSAPNADPWYDRSLLASSGVAASTTLPVIMNDWTGGAVNARLRLIGVTDFEGNLDDHEIDLAFNGQYLQTFTEDGLVDWRVEYPVEGREGAGSLELTLTGETGYDSDLVYVDNWGLDYERSLRVVDDRLIFEANSGNLEIAGFSGPATSIYAWDGSNLLYLEANVASQAGAWKALVSLSDQATGSALFRSGFESVGDAAKADRRFTVWASTASRVLTPAIEPAAETAQLPPVGVDLLVIVPQHLVDALDPYVQWRAMQGVSVHVALAEGVVAGYGHGRNDPIAIQQYLQAAAQRGVGAVLLAGTSTSDPFDRLGTGTENWIPTSYVRTHDVFYFTPADSLLADFNDDGIADIPLGRWPVQSENELNAIIAKTMAYDGLSGRTAVVSADAETRFSNQAIALGNLVSLSAPADQVLLELYGTDPEDVQLARDDLLAALNTGIDLALFSGHGAPSSWTFSSFFNTTAIGELTNTNDPFFALPLTCYVSYFVSPRQVTLGHLLMNGDVGAAAIAGPATVSLYAPNTRLTEAFLTQMETGQAAGVALNQAKLTAIGLTRDAKLNWNLLGDPLLRLPPQ